jgi:hypothetical protein
MPVFDRWELLTSMQSLLIYLLMRLAEGETDYNNSDVQILATIRVCVSSLPRFRIDCDIKQMANLAPKNNRLSLKF